MNRRCIIIACSIATLFALFSVPAATAYTLTPLWNDPGPVQIIPGLPFNLNFDLTSTTGETCDSAIFNVAFSTPGMVVNSYSWGGSFSGSIYDNSNPAQYHFENFVSGPAFGTGTLLSLNVTMPTDIPILSILPITISVHADPGVFALGTQEFTPQAGPDLTINVVPEPSSMALILVGCSMFTAASLLRKKLYR